MKLVMVALLMVTSVSHASDMDPSLLSESAQQEIYRQAVFQESLGQTLSAREQFQRILNQAPKSSTYVKMASQKLCRYDNRFCATPDSRIFQAKRDPLLAERAAEIRNFLSEIDGIEVTTAGSRIVIDGECTTPRDLERVRTVAALYEEKAVTSIVRLSPVFQRTLTYAVANDINDPEVTVRTIDEALVLEGVVDGQQEKENMQRIAESYALALPSKKSIVNHLKIRPERLPASASN